jgi:hypothetical protein
MNSEYGNPDEEGEEMESTDADIEQYLVDEIGLKKDDWE